MEGEPNKVYSKIRGIHKLNFQKEYSGFPPAILKYYNSFPLLIEENKNGGHHNLKSSQIIGYRKTIKIINNFLHELANLKFYRQYEHVQKG
jgi:hypothetical protein